MEPAKELYYLMNILVDTSMAFIPTRPPPDLKTLLRQANTLLPAEARGGGEAIALWPFNAGAPCVIIFLTRCITQPARSSDMFQDSGADKGLTHRYIP
jgi:hypothetical protein